MPTIDPNICAICGVELNFSDQLNRQPTDYNNVCNKHGQYSGWPLLWKAKMDAAFPYEEAGRECEVCFSRIDDDYWLCVLKDDPYRTIITCREHHSNRFDYQVDLTRRKLGFPDLKENTHFLRSLISATKKITES